MPEVKDPKKETLPALYAEKRGELLELVKGSMDAERWERFALMALRNPAVLRCTPVSLARSLYTNARLGLPLDGVHAVLVPFGTECTHVTGYPGWVSLYTRHAGITHVDPVLVFKGDHFRVLRGSEPKIEHEEKPGVDRTRVENLLAAYAVGHLVNGATKFWVCWADELDKLANDQIAKKGDKSTWKTSPLEMRRKTPIIRLRKGLTMTENVAKLLAEAEREEFGEGGAIDVEGQDVTGAVSSVDELMAARKAQREAAANSAADASAAAISAAAEQAAEDGLEADAPPSIRDVEGIPVEYSWEQIKGDVFGGKNAVLGPLTPEKLVPELRKGTGPVVDSAKVTLKRGQEIAADGKTPSKAYQALALAFEMAKKPEAEAGF